jgi:hypothetical protein
MLAANGLCTIPNAMMVGFREPTDEEWNAGISELEAVLGPVESARQSWRRRLVIMASGEWRLLISECGFLSGGDYGLLPFTKGAADAIPVALDIAAGVALLKSKDNPELEGQRRRQFIDDLNRRHAQQAEDERNRSIEAGRRQQDAQARGKTYRWAEWQCLVDWQRLAYSVALAIDGGEDLASALRRIAGSSQSFNGERSTPIAAPSAKWW